MARRKENGSLRERMMVPRYLDQDSLSEGIRLVFYTCEPHQASANSFAKRTKRLSYCSGILNQASIKGVWKQKRWYAPVSAKLALCINCRSNEKERLFNSVTESFDIGLCSIIKLIWFLHVEARDWKIKSACHCYDVTSFVLFHVIVQPLTTVLFVNMLSATIETIYLCWFNSQNESPKINLILCRQRYFMTVVYYEKLKEFVYRPKMFFLSPRTKNPSAYNFFLVSLD